MTKENVKLYDSSDMARISCDDCRGCFSCCEGMGDTIILNPYDMKELCQNLHQSAETLLRTSVELNMLDGVILPNLKMTGEQSCCSYLNEEGRCSIHAFRPGLCRLFPLGRNYKDGSFQYFVLENACPKAGKSKVKIEKWLGIPKLKQHEAFLCRWHYFLKDYQKFVKRAVSAGEDEAALRQLNMMMLQGLYLTAYDPDTEFYAQFESRVARFESVLKSIGE